MERDVSNKVFVYDMVNGTTHRDMNRRLEVMTNRLNKYMSRGWDLAGIEITRGVKLMFNNSRLLFDDGTGTLVDGVGHEVVPVRQHLSFIYQLLRENNGIILPFFERVDNGNG